ncbi:MAG TPA: hypothetical protein VJO35_03790 [Terriglobales bacterium]|nr:hypothetical protein [Terriglobales bacterium]
MFSGRPQPGKNASELIAKAQQTIERALCRQARAEQILRNSDLVGKPGFTFLITDLKLGMTFARIASHAPEGSEKRTRNKANARKAFDSIYHLSHRVLLSNDKRQELDGKLAQLRRALEQLGEVFVQ